MVKKVQFNKEIKSIPTNDLVLRIQEEDLRLKKLFFAHAISPIENPVSIRLLKRDISRLKTELQNRALA